MSFYKVEEWSIRDVAKAFKEKTGDESHRKVVIPVFQRGLRWEPKKRALFIESINRGYPFGALLFAQTSLINVYSVVDGLQRGSTVCDFVYNPLCNIDKIDENSLNEIRKTLFPNNENKTINNSIQSVILKYFKDARDFDKIDLLKLAKNIFNEFPNDEDKFKSVENIYNVLQETIKIHKDTYTKICSATVPIIVYSGPQELLCDIFNRINKEGIPLNDYEIYSAIWDQRKFKINCEDIVDKVIKKYFVLLKNDFELKDFKIIKSI